MPESASDSTSYFTLGPEEVLQRLEVTGESGLSAGEAQARRQQYGPNLLRAAKTRSPWSILIDQFKSIVIVLLLVAAAAAFATARLPEGMALVAVTIVNTLIGFFSEWQAVRSMEALRDRGEQHATVRRDGREQQIEAADVVPGDIVLVDTEMLIPADIRLLDTDQLRISEAALTGESVPVDKSPAPIAEDAPLAERTNMLYKGTSVAEGSGVGVVVATGMHTELGKISDLADKAEGQATPLQKQLDKLGRRLAWITIAVAVMVGIAGLVAGRETVLMIETAIALGAAAIPEGLPVVATIALARGMYLMAKRNAIVNRLTAVETLGSTRVIFTDKTGTLTENRMTVARLVTAKQDHQLDRDDGDSAVLPDDPLLSHLIEVSTLCSNATYTGDGQDTTGDPTEVALLKAGARFGFDRQSLLDRWPETREEAFNPNVMMMATYHQHPEGQFVAVKGAPEAVLESCTQISEGDHDGELTEEQRRQWIERANELAGEGLRLLAAADKRVDSTEVDPYQGLRFLGLIGLFDPPRTDVRPAIEECKRAGMRVVMVTGDRPDTGQAIGKLVGLNEDGLVIHGSKLSHTEKLDSQDEQRVLNATVFARVTPEQKLDLVKLYQNRGEVVAMTGDGVNDAPALKQADIGVAMGKRGTDAAKQVADMVLEDDSFATIVAAVRQGRIIFANIRKSVIFMLCTNIAEVLVVTLASLTPLPIPLRPLQILYLNVLTDVFPALALGLGKGTQDVMKRPPRQPGESVLTRHHWKAIGGWSVVVGSCVLISLGLALTWLGLSETQAVTVSFLTLAFSKLWFVINLRDRGSSLWKNDIVGNPWIWASLVLCSGLLLLAVYWPWLSRFLETEPLGWQAWLLVLGMSLVPAIIGLFAPMIHFYAGDHRKVNNKDDENAQQ